MRLRAQVRRVTGATRHYRAHLEGGVATKFFLLYMDEHGACLTDTWHQTLQQAKAQATHEFGIGEDEWEVVTS